MSFVHLHVHSKYSLLDGMCRHEELLEKVKAMGMTSIAVTDHGGLYGAFEFYIKAKETGIKPIIGVETYKAKRSRHDKQPSEERDQYHLVLLAKNLTGYQNLLKIVSISYLEGFYYKPRIDFEILEKYHEGIIAFSGCLAGEIPSLILQSQEKEAERILKKYTDIFGKDFYLELQRHPDAPDQDRVNDTLVKMSRKFGVPLVATNDVHYLEKEDAYAQEILLCIQTQRAIFEKNRPLSMVDTPDYYLKSPAEMMGQFSDLPEAIENTVKIANECNVEIPYGNLILPKFATPNYETEDDYLRVLTYQNVARTKEFPQDVVTKRLDYELKIIKDKGYSAYFLIVQDFVNWAKNKEIAVGPGRGSTAGSLVAYLLRITDINPLDYNLPFERFLNPERPTPPDADVDFADIRRDEVIEYVTNKYGKDKIAHIITFGKMEARLAVRDVTRALGMSYSTGDRLAKMIPQGKQGFTMSISQAIEETPQLKLAYQTEADTKKVLDIARKIEGLPRHASVHAAGVVFSDKALTDYVPLQKEAKEGKIITQFDMYSLDLNAVSDNKAVGLLKVDFLGLRNLTILEQALGYVEKLTGQKIDIHEVSLTDKETFDLIGKGETIGVFQLESGGMKRLAKDLKPEKITDIIAMVALYRPGPMDLIPTFIEGKRNSKKVKYLHKELQPILEETYGVLVYQEQVMLIANRLAGFSMSEADILRMAMGKKKKSLMDKGKKKFIEGAVKNGYTKTLAQNIFGFMEKFAAYGFNKPHAASYALIAYWTAYVKANYPVEFMTALLSAELQGVAGALREIKMAQALEECRRMEIKVLPPDINTSLYSFSIDGKAIRFGLSAIKNVGQSAIDSILEARVKGPFNGFKDFLYRVDLRRVNKKTVESLIKANAFVHFGNRATLLLVYPGLAKDAGEMKDDREKGQFGLFTQSVSTEHLKDNFLTIDEVSEDEIFDMEKEVIGFLISKNPLKKFEALITKKATKKIGEVNESDKNKTIIIAGLISGKKLIKTKKDNSEMAFINIFDETGSIEVVVFPRSFAKLKTIFNINSVILLKGKVNDRDGRLSVLLENAVCLDNVTV